MRKSKERIYLLKEDLRKVKLQILEDSSNLGKYNKKNPLGELLL